MVGIHFVDMRCVKPYTSLGLVIMMREARQVLSSFELNVSDKSKYICSFISSVG